MSSSLDYKLAAFLIVFGALSGIVCLMPYYLRDFGTKGKLPNKGFPFFTGASPLPQKRVTAFGVETKKVFVSDHAQPKFHWRQGIELFQILLITLTRLELKLLPFLRALRATPEASYHF